MGLEARLDVGLKFVCIGGGVEVSEDAFVLAPAPITKLIRKADKRRLYLINLAKKTLDV